LHNSAIMKKLLICLSLFCYVLTSCNSSGSAQDNDDNEAKSEGQKKITKRNYSINKSNSYSNLFFDSLKMESYIKENNLNDSVTRRMRSFYNARNYQFAWFSSDGFTEQALGFWNLHDYVTSHINDTTLRDKALQKKMNALLFEEDLSVSENNASFLKTELKLTEHFIMYILNNYEKGYVKRREMERFIPFQKQNVLEIADSLLNKKHSDNKYFEDVNRPYKKLKEQLSNYYTIAKQGGWPVVNTTKKSLKKGMSDVSIPSIKRMLSMTGDMPGTDTSMVFTDTLEMGVKTFQARYGYTPDGIIGAQIIKEMKVPAIVRLEQIMMNLERMRWIPQDATGRLIIVNIPEFKLHMYDGKEKAFDMNVVVGKVGHNTMMFNGDLNQVVFSPYWNVPESIVEKEILPSLASNPGYLESQNMEQIGMNGDLPDIRQRPGPGNALGKVKFLFPNSFNIYFHDTPSKGLFEKDKRAFSHGCIRLAEPEKMANYVLRDQPEWTPEKINAAMNAGTEKFVKVKDPIPVVITYYTAWVDEYGRLNFRDDIYSHDKKLAGKMFAKAF
jgi:L,D-transpeptidase YcbB